MFNLAEDIRQQSPEQQQKPNWGSVGEDPWALNKTAFNKINYNQQHLIENCLETVLSYIHQVSTSEVLLISFLNEGWAQTAGCVTDQCVLPSNTECNNQEVPWLYVVTGLALRPEISLNQRKVLTRSLSAYQWSDFLTPINSTFYSFHVSQ